jgi:hypothetical protein
MGEYREEAEAQERNRRQWPGSSSRDKKNEAQKCPSYKGRMDTYADGCCLKRAIIELASRPHRTGYAERTAPELSDSLHLAIGG